MYSEQHPAHSKCLINISYCYKDDNAFIHSTNIYETFTVYRGINSKQKYFCLHGICILVKGTDDKQDICSFLMKMNAMLKYIAG